MSLTVNPVLCIGKLKGQWAEEHLWTVQFNSLYLFAAVGVSPVASVSFGIPSHNWSPQVWKDRTNPRDMPSGPDTQALHISHSQEGWEIPFLTPAKAFFVKPAELSELHTLSFGASQILSGSQPTLNYIESISFPAQDWRTEMQVVILWPVLPVYFC